MIPLFTRLNPNDPTTREGNPGDYFICLGVQHLISKVLGGEPQWLMLSKFSPENAMSMMEYVKETGFLVYAGMPQYNRFGDWCFWYDDGLWRDMLLPNNIKTICLAGGAGYPSTDIHPEAFAELCVNDPKSIEVMELRKQTGVLFTARDPYAHAFLKAFGIKGHLLPCSAIFAGHRMRSRPVKSDMTLVVPPNPRSLCFGEENRDERIIAWTRKICSRLIETGRHPVVLCNCGYEWDLLRKHTDLDVRYSNNYLWQLRMYEQCTEMIGARIHAVLPTYGMGQARCVGVSVDTRGSAVGMLPKTPVFSFYDVEEDPGILVDALEQAEPCAPGWLAEIEQTYVALIKNALAEVGGLEPQACS